MNVSIWNKGAAVLGALTVIALATFGSIKIGSSGTTISSFQHATSTVNPESIGAYGATSTLVSISGLDADDSVWVSTRPVSWTYATNTIDLVPVYSSAGVARLWFYNSSSTVHDMPSADVGLDMLKH